MEKLSKFIWLLIFFATSSCISISYAQDRSSITIRIHNSSGTAKDTPAEVILIDSQGRRTGFDATAPFNEILLINEVHEIPRSNYTIEGIADNTSSGEDEPFYRELYVHKPLLGRYIIQIIGRQIGGYRLFCDFHKSNLTMQPYEDIGFSVIGQTVAISVEYNPAPDSPPLVIIKTVTFDTLRQDLTVAQKLTQLGDDKFVDSLTRMINLAEKLSIKCDNPKGHDKSKGHKKDKVCKPTIAVLNMFIKRLEIANRKCDNKPQFCDEEPEWNNFRKKYGKDKDFKNFFKEWDKDKWHKHKKKCKRFVTDEALKIIKEDAQWLIKSLGGVKSKKDKKGKK